MDGSQISTPTDGGGAAVTPASVAPESGSQPSSQPAVPDQGGQGENGEATPVNRLHELARKKGWDVEKAGDLIVDSYTQLESKLGNWKTVEQQAQQFAQIQGTLPDLQKKAEAWDAAQRYLESVGDDGKPDLSRMSVQDLASLWQNGQIGLADVPPQLQYQVQQHVVAAEKASEQMVQQQATQLVDQYPVLRDPYVADLVATKIEAGVDPHAAIKQVQAMLSNAEKQFQERQKQDNERIRNGNLESPGSPAPTRPSVKISTVGDAFRAAKAELGMK